MSEFDEKLNALLSDPNSMARIMELAQSLGGTGNGGPGPSPAPPPPPGGSSGGSSPPPNPFPPDGGGIPDGRPPGGGNTPSGANPLTSLLGGLDPALLAKLLPLAQELSGTQNSQAAALLTALEPYLKPERRANVPRALQLARLLRLGKRFLRDREGGAFV